MWRGSFVVGSIPASYLPFLEDILARVPVVRHTPEWNCQNWVSEGIRRLRMQGLNIIPTITHATLQTEMMLLLEAWEMGEI
ncbi:hypothetical protein BV22DRAFT_1035595 [Leucogyrophana mollusca]|uniref:Uncharacterized protein n=1 Tax=Leucogyrophana mollusca TaxID=85980 RepID=A0ACB8BFF0_9AGAM|nr:hypothetical protein BV22DRAFT_1035595 [Leucogyrophana mollusca]